MPDAELAALYGVDPPVTPGARTELPTGQRSGLLTQASFLAAAANADQPHPVLRGRFVREKMLCQHIPDPPPGLMVTPPQIEPGVSGRERWSRHSVDPTCASCHRLMDPIGFMFGHYDAIGRWQDTDDGAAIDASGEVSGVPDLAGTFDGAVALSEGLASSENARSCYATQWLRFAIGRLEADEDTCSVERVDQAFLESDGDIRHLLRDVVATDAFRFVRKG
jgi:hypothetical protein